VSRSPPAEPRVRLRDDQSGRGLLDGGWCNTMPGGLLTAISARGDRTDLVTVPPGSSEQAAQAAMHQAAKAGNHEHAPAILAAIAASALPLV
jgi:hypothetical protein